MTLDDAIEVLGGRRRIASGRAIDVKQEHRRNEKLVDVEHIVEVVKVIEVAEEREPHLSSVSPQPSSSIKKLDRKVNTEIRQLRSKHTQVSDGEEGRGVRVEDATMFFESSEGKSYVNLSNDAEQKALELLNLY